MRGKVPRVHRTLSFLIVTAACSSGGQPSEAPPQPQTDAPTDGRDDAPAATSATARPAAGGLPETVAGFCTGGGPPGRRAVALEDAAGVVGGYMLATGIMDAPLTYLDPDGQALATFHIFGSDEEKAAASAVIDPLRAKFPRERPLACP